MIYKVRTIAFYGRRTSIRLESPFWETLQDIAAQQGTTLTKLLKSIYDRYRDQSSVSNFTPFLRMYCINYFRKNGHPWGCRGMPQP